MHSERSFLEEQGIVVENVTGPVTTRELWEKFKSLFNDSRYKPDLRGICDLRGATAEMDRKEFVKFAEKVRQSKEFGNARWAIVTDEPLLTAFAQIFCRYVNEDHRVAVFATMEAAEEFVGADSQPA